MKCRICGSDEQKFEVLPVVILEGRNSLIRCDICGAVMTKKKATPEENKKIYDDLFSTGAYVGHRDEFHRIAENKGTYFPYRAWLFNRMQKAINGKQIIEIGGGVGAFGYYVQQKGYSYTDFDISEEALGFAKQLELETCLFEEGTIPPLKENSADMVVMWEVIEHVWDVQRYFVQIHRALEKGGCFLLSTPNIDRRGYMNNVEKPGLGSPPIHINFFSEKSLDISLKNAGFRKVNFFHRRLERPQWNLASIIYHARIFLGVDPVKTIYCVAYK